MCTQKNKHTQTHSRTPPPPPPPSTHKTHTQNHKLATEKVSGRAKAAQTPQATMMVHRLWTVGQGHTQTWDRGTLECCVMGDAYQSSRWSPMPPEPYPDTSICLERGDSKWCWHASSACRMRVTSPLTHNIRVSHACHARVACASSACPASMSHAPSPPHTWHKATDTHVPH